MFEIQTIRQQMPTFERLCLQFCLLLGSHNLEFTKFFQKTRSIQVKNLQFGGI